MERHRQIHVGELLLRIEICWVCNHPPAVDIGVNVPNVMLMVEDVLSIDFLQKLDFQVGCLPIHIVDNGLSFFRCCGQHR